MLRITSALAVALLAFPLPHLAAQTSAALSGLEGKKVRVSVGLLDRGEIVGSLELRGTLVELRGDSVHVMQDGGTMTRFPVSRVQSVSVTSGRDRWRGARVGALIGVGLGLLVSTVPPECHDGYGYDCRADGSKPSFAEYVATNVSDMTMFGAMFGAIIGTERWTPVIAARPVASARSVGPGIGLRFSF